MPLILSVMEQAGVEFSALDRIAVTRGPGSFTGLRIGLAAARGIGLAADKPVIGIDRFAIYREQIKTPDKNLLVVIDSKRSELFCQFYPTNGEPEEPRMLTREEVASFLDKHKNTIVTADTLVMNTDFHPPSENESVTCAALAAKTTPGDTAYLPRPLYIRPPDVTFPRAVKSA